MLPANTKPRPEFIFPTIPFSSKRLISDTRKETAVLIKRNNIPNATAVDIIPTTVFKIGVPEFLNVFCKIGAIKLLPTALQ